MPKDCNGEAPSGFGMLERECEDEDAEVQEDGVLFYVNRSGFPISQATWKRMWRHASKLHPEGKSMAKKIVRDKCLPEVPIPQAPVNFPQNTLIPERLDMIQKYMNELQYNHTGTQFFEIRKNRPISGLMDSAREMIREALPIKCLEAVILSLHLTSGMPGVDRFPISFKTEFAGHTHRHVVLGIFYNGMYGALGLSRRDDLMYKQLHFKTLSRLIADYITCYKQYCHEVRKVKVGLPVPHDPHSFEPIVWKHVSLSLADMNQGDVCRVLEKHARDMRSQTRRQTALAAVYVPHKLRTSTTETSSSQKTSGQSHNSSVTPSNANSSKASHKSKKTKGDKSTKSQGKIVQHSTVAAGTATEDEDDHDQVKDTSETTTTTQYQIRI